MQQNGSQFLLTAEYGVVNSIPRSTTFQSSSQSALRLGDDAVIVKLFPFSIWRAASRTSLIITAELTVWWRESEVLEDRNLMRTASCIISCKFFLHLFGPLSDFHSHSSVATVERYSGNSLLTLLPVTRHRL